jgi:glutamate-1-semialdehyde 2,1-aminomutase
MSETRHLDAISGRYSEARPLSQAHFGRDRQVMPGGVKGAYYHAPYPLTMARGEGCYLWDVDGHRYVDFANHHTSQVLGHNHEAVTEAIATQLQRGIALGAAMGNEVELAEEMCSRVKSLERVRFCNSGTEATLHAIRLARGFTGRPKIAKFEGGYHGSHDAVEISVAPALDKAGPAEAPHAVPQVRGMAPHAIDEMLILPYDDEASVARLVSAHREELACIILDPKAGVLPQRAEFMRSVAETAHRSEVPLILDEIVGFRVGTGGIQEHFGITPDLTTFGKIIGGGLPVGAFGGRAELMDLLDGTRGPTGFFQSGTYSGHPLVMAAGMATLSQLTPAAFDHMNELTQRLCDGIERQLQRLGVGGKAVHNGSVFSIYFTDGELTDYRSLARCDKKRAQPVFLALLERGYFLSHNLGMNALSLPTQVEHVDGLIEAFGEAVGATL